MGAVLSFIGRGLVWLAGTTAGQALIGYLKDKITSKISAWWAKHKDLQAIDKKAEESVQPLKEAKTKEEINVGIDKSLDEF